MTYKMLSYIIFVILLSFVSTQTIDETLDQIALLKKKIAQNEILVEQKISNMQKSNPLFAEKDIFESDQDYLQRMMIAMPEFDKIRKQYLSDFWYKMSILRSQLFETNHIEIILRKEDYDANQEQWPMKIKYDILSDPSISSQLLENSRIPYKEQSFDLIMKISKKDASNIFKNWSKIEKKGILTIDIGDRIGLAKVFVKDPVTGYEFSHEIRPMKKFEYSVAPDYIPINPCPIAFTPDGLFVISFTGNQFYINNLVDNNITTKRDKSSYGTYHAASALSPDGKLFAIVINDLNYVSKDIIIYNIQYAESKFIEGAPIFIDDIQKVAVLKSDTPIQSIAFSPDSKFLVAAHDELILYNIETNKMVRKCSKSSELAYRSSFKDINFSSNGQFSAAASSVGIVINDFSTDTFDISVFPHSTMKSKMIYAVAISPDDSFIAFGGEDGRLHIFSTSLIGDQSFTLKKEATHILPLNLLGDIRSLTFSPDSKYLGIGSRSSSIIYDYKSKNIIKSFHNGGGVSFSPDGRYFAAGGDLYRTFLTPELIISNTNKSLIND